MSDAAWKEEAAFWEGYHYARREALEEAARVMDGYAEEHTDPLCNRLSKNAAAAIRKLMEKGNE